MAPSRRHFLATAGSVAFGALACGSGGAAGWSAQRRAGVGVQLYTLRAEMQRSVSATLARVAEIGCREVEFAGYFGHSAAQIAALLREHGLGAPSTHVALAEVRAAAEATFAGAARAGHRFVTVPWIDAGERRTEDDWKRLAELFNERGAQARAAGLRLAYHNQDYDHAPLRGVTPLERLLADTDAALVGFQLDVYWAVRAGADVIALLARHPGRFLMTHLKDSAGAPGHRMVDVGTGTIDFPGILAAAQAGGVQHHFIEHDEPADPFASVTASFEYIAELQQR